MKYFCFLIGLLFWINNSQLSRDNSYNIDFNCSDLIISELKIDSFSTNKITYSFGIKNIGIIPAILDGPTEAQYDNVGFQAFLSSDTIFNNAGDIPAGGSILGFSPLGNLEADGTVFRGDFSASVSVDTLTHPYLTIQIDWSGKIDECNENNNIFYVLIEHLIFDTSEFTYFVNTTNDYDDGICDEIHCSLREAINASIEDGEDSEIHFNIPGNSPFEIKLDTELPSFHSIIIDATTQSNFNLGDIVLDGVNVPLTSVGLELRGSCGIYGIHFKNFDSSAIYVRGGVNNQIGKSNRGNIFSNNYHGVTIEQASNTVNIENNFFGTDALGNNIERNYSQTIDCRYANNVLIANNIIHNNNQSLYVFFGSNIKIINNSFKCNGYAPNIVNPTSTPSPIISKTFNTLNQITGTSNPNDTIEVYYSENEECDYTPCQGSIFLGQTIADNNGDWLLNLNNNLEIGKKITAMVNGTNGIPSNFADCVIVNNCNNNNLSAIIEGVDTIQFDSVQIFNAQPAGGSENFLSHIWRKDNSAFLLGGLSINNIDDGTASIKGTSVGRALIHYEVIDSEGCFFNAQKYIEVAVDCSNSALTKIEVTNTNNTGLGSLRHAMECTNGSETLDSIHFNIPGQGPHVIYLDSYLPFVTDDGFVIDGSSQPNGKIILDGMNKKIGGIYISNSDNVGIYGLTFQHFDRNPLSLGTCNNVQIGDFGKGNRITTSLNSLILRGNNIKVIDNIIGTNEDNKDLGNVYGIYSIGATNVLITNNTIGYSQNEGIYLFANSLNNTLTKNKLICNNIGIGYYDLVPPNNNKSTSTINAVNDSIIGIAEVGDSIDIYLADFSCVSTACQGNVFLGKVLTNYDGRWAIKTPSFIQPNDQITSTATDIDGNTSKFSNCYTVLPDECFLAESLPVNDQACSSVGIISDLKQMTNSTPSPYNDCNNTYAGNDAWYKIKVPKTGNFLVRTNTSNTVVPVIEVYTGCDNPAQNICTILDTLPYVMVFENYDTNATIFLRVWDKDNAVVNSDGSALLHLTAHKLDSLKSNWDICDYENLISQNPTNLSRRESNTFILSYEPNTPQNVIDQDSIAFTDMMQMEKKKSCNCGSEELQLWSTDKPVELDGRRRYAKRRGNVDTTNYNYIFETVEFQVNSYATGKQYNTDVAMDAEGNFAMVWLDEQRGHNYGRVYLSSGNPITVEFQIGTSTKTQYSSQVGMDADGDFVVVWHEKDETDANAKYEVKARLYDNEGSPKNAAFTVSVQPNDNATNPNVAMDNDGNFVVVWHVGASVFTRRFNATGSAQGTVIELDPSIDNGVEPHPSIATNYNGDFIVVWAGDDADKKGIYGQRFNAAGSPIGGLIEANTQQNNEQNYPDAILRNDGSFVIAWESYEEEGLGLDYGVFAQQFDNTGTKVNSAFQVNSYTQDAQKRPSIANFNDNSFLIAWSSFGQDGFAEGIYAKLFDATGNPITPNFDDSDRNSGADEFRMNFYNDPQQDKPKTATNGENIFMGAWEDGANDGSLEGIFAQRYESITVDNTRVFKPIGTATPSTLLGDQLEYAPIPYHPRNAVKKAKVAIIDTGVDNLHNLLSSAIWYNPEATDTDNCLIGDEIGYDFVNGTGIPSDVDGHGTQVNGILTNGFEADVKLELMNLKFHELNKGNVFDAICAIYYAVDNGANILNLSWGFEASEEPAILKKALQYASDNDVLIVTTAGNTSKNNDLINKYPANLDIPNMIVVTSYYYKQTSNEIKLSNYASYGQNNVDIAAYGYVETASIAGGKTDAAGTSMAAPAVARTAASIKGLYPILTAAEIKDCILSTAELINALSNRVKTGGILDHDAALACAQTKMEEILAAACASSGLNLSSTIANETCMGNDGSIALNITGNNAVTDILWSTSETSQNISDLSADTYEVTVTDAARCMQSLTIELMDDCINAPCQSNIALNNLNLSDSIYQSDNTIVSNSSIEGGKNVMFKAAQSVTLNAGFHAQAGSQFLAVIEDCNTNTLNKETANNRATNLVDNKVTTLPALSAKIYPNPTQASLNIEVEKPEMGFYLELYDVMGRRLKRQEISTNQMTLDVNHLSTGLYFLRIDSQLMEKFILNKK